MPVSCPRTSLSILTLFEKCGTMQRLYGDKPHDEKEVLPTARADVPMGLQPALRE